MIIGLGNKMRVGKDTVGSILVEDYGFKRRALATPLKQFCNSVYQAYVQGKDAEILEDLCKFYNLPEGLNLKGLMDQSALFDKDAEGKLRVLLQYVGDRIREIDPYHFANYLIYTINTADNVVVTDVRYPEEFEVLRSNGAHLCRVVRDGVPISNHISETALDNAKWDYVIPNNKSIEELKDLVAETLNDIVTREDAHA